MLAAEARAAAAEAAEAGRGEGEGWHRRAVGRRRRERATASSERAGQDPLRGHADRVRLLPRHVLPCHNRMRLRRRQPRHRARGPAAARTGPLPRRAPALPGPAGAAWRRRAGRPRRGGPALGQQGGQRAAGGILLGDGGERGRREAFVILRFSRGARLVLFGAFPATFWRDVLIMEILLSSSLSVSTRWRKWRKLAKPLLVRNLFFLWGSLPYDDTQQACLSYPL